VRPGHGGPLEARYFTVPFLIFSLSKFLRRDDESSCGCFFRMSIRTLSDDIDPRLLRCIFMIDFESRLDSLEIVRESENADSHLDGALDEKFDGDGSSGDRI